MPQSASSNAIAVHCIGKRFGRHWALAHLDFQLGVGESLLLVGANGSGKTTLLRLLCGLIRPTKGTLSVFGLSPAENPLDVRPRLTLVSHRSFLYEQLTASEHVDLWLALAQTKAAQAQETQRETADCGQLLADVGLDQRGDEPVANFSAGMRKRLTLLRTKIEDPDLILLDEPFSALDPAGQAMIEQWLAELHQAGKTLVVASHALERARSLCRDAIVLRQGQISWRGEAANITPELLDAPVTTTPISQESDKTHRNNADQKERQ